MIFLIAATFFLLHSIYFRHTVNRPVRMRALAALAKEPRMELTLTVDGNMLSVSYHNGNVVFYWRDSGNCDVAEVAMTITQAKALGLGFIACAEEDEQ